MAQGWEAAALQRSVAGFHPVAERAMPCPKVSKAKTAKKAPVTKKTLKKAVKKAPKATIAATPRKSAKPPQAQPSPAPDTSAVEPTPKRTRWTSLDSATRALQNKFPLLTLTRLNSITNSKGESPAVVVERAMRGKEEGYLKQKFWTDLALEFNLSEDDSAFDLVPQPRNAEEVDPDLFAAIKSAEDSNPAARSVVGYCKFLEYGCGLNETELYGLVQGSRVRVNVTPKIAHTMQADGLCFLFYFCFMFSALFCFI